MIHGKNFIGQQLSAESTSTFNGHDIANNTAIPIDFYEATSQEIDVAIQKANTAFCIYKNKTGKEKAAFLIAIAAELEALDALLIETASKESGLPIARITGERGRTTGQLRLFAQMLEEGSWVNAIIDTAILDRVPMPRSDIRQMQTAIGPVAIFGASNFPLAFSVAGGDTVSALAAGCPVVFKAHPAHPATCELVAGAIINAAQKCNMPGGVFSLVHGINNEIGTTLVSHPLIKAVGFTGSFKGGKALYDLVVQRKEPIPIFAEMGSVNPVVFLPQIIEEKYDQLAENFAASVVMGAGQFCTNPGIFLVVKNEFSQSFINALQKAMSTKATLPLLTSNIQKAYCNGIQQQLQIDGAIGLTLFDADKPQPHLLQVSAKVAIQNPSLTEEVFGPSTVAIVADDMEELIECCQQLQGQLTASVHGTDVELKNSVALLEVLQLKSGRLIINGYPTGVEVGHAMVHGGPFPASTDVRSTSVGTQAIYRFTRPVCLQDFPDHLLPDELKADNPLGITRKLNGVIQC